MAYIALMAVLISVCSWLSVPAAIPFTMQTYAVFTALLLLGGRRGSIAVAVYIALGAVGLPVFSGGETVGTLTDILCRPGNDVYVVTAADKKREYLIPAVPEFILERNVDEGYIRVRLIEGMASDEI